MTREEAIETIKTAIAEVEWEYPMNYAAAFEVAIEALEQKPQTDEIILSKKEYRELLSNEFEHGYDKGLSDAIKSLEQEPCEDCVNRQTVLNTLFYKSDNNCEVVLNKELQDRIKALPSVTPQQKIGYWINAYPDIEPNPMFMYGICSVCGFKQSISNKLNYCPNCGAKMEVEEC